MHTRVCLRAPPRALQVAEANSAREEVVALLGGYQSSIRELKDQHSVLVVRLQGEKAALKAEVGGRAGGRVWWWGWVGWWVGYVGVWVGWWCWGRGRG